MQHAYPAIFLLSSAIFMMLKDKGVRPDVIAGYDTGTYAALFAAGCISFPDGLYLINKYATLYQEALLMLPSVSILNVKNYPRAKLEKLCKQVSRGDDRATMAFFMAPDEQVVSGPSGIIDTLKEHLEKTDAVVHQVPIEVGLHSSLLTEVAAQFKVYLSKVDFKKLQIPVYNPLNAKPVADATAAQDMIVDMVHTPIEWLATMQQLSDCDLIVQCGPGTIFATQAESLFPEKKIFSITQMADVEQLHQYLEENKMKVE
jgi:[acyl-carrier-protein] S-malonyltransferase